MALALDGQAGNFSSSATSFAVALTTSSANDVIIVCVEANQGPVASVTSPNVTFTRRSTNNLGGSRYPIECWYGIAASPLSSETITVTQQAADFIGVVAFGVSGANTSSPFDTNGPYTISSNTQLSATTSASNTFIFGAYRIATDPSPNAGAGFTQIGAVANSFELVEYAIFSTPQTGLTIAWGSAVGPNGTNGAVGDAIVQAGSGGGSAGTIGLQIGISGAGNALVKSAGTVGLQLGITGKGAATAKSAGTIPLNLALSGAAPHVVSAAGTVGLNLNISAIGVKKGGIDVGYFTADEARKLKRQTAERQKLIEAELEAKRADDERLRAGLREALHGPAPPAVATEPLPQPEEGDSEDEEIELLLMSL